MDNTSVTVVSAFLLAPAQEELVRQTLQQTVGASGTIRFSVDTTLLGGLMIQVGDDLVDLSLKKKIADAENFIKEQVSLS